MSRTILITGATSDIGRAIASEQVLAGNRVVLVGRNELKLKSIASDLNIDSSFQYCYDNSDLSDLKTLFSQITNEHGKLDSLICCAGCHEFKPLKISKSNDFEFSFNANTLPSLMFAKFFSSNLYSNKCGSIVFISSIASILGEAGLSAYSASKGALNSATRSLAVELAPKNIRVNCISPGWVETTHAKEVKLILGEEKVNEIKRDYPLGFGLPEDIAGLCSFLVSDRSRWITGQNIVIDGGRTLV